MWPPHASSGPRCAQAGPGRCRSGRSSGVRPQGSRHGRMGSTGEVMPAALHAARPTSLQPVTDDSCGCRLHRCVHDLAEGLSRGQRSRLGQEAGRQRSAAQSHRGQSRLRQKGVDSRRDGASGDGSRRGRVLLQTPDIAERSLRPQSRPVSFLSWGMRGAPSAVDSCSGAPKCSVRSSVTSRSPSRDLPCYPDGAVGRVLRGLGRVPGLASCRSPRSSSRCWPTPSERPPPAGARLFATSMVVPAHRDAVSSAYMYGVVPGIRLRMSASGADHNRKRVGTRTFLCGRPARKIRSRLLQPLSSVCARRSRRKLQIQEIRQSGISCFSSLTQSRRWSTVSYAREKSKAVKSERSVEQSLRPPGSSCVTGGVASHLRPAAPTGPGCLQLSDPRGTPPAWVG